MSKYERDGGYLNQTDTKLFVLFLLDELSYPLTEQVLTEIIAADGQVGRFDFASCLSELVEQGHVQALQLEGETYYVIEHTGHLVATELQNQLMDSIRERSRRTALRILSLHKMGAVPQVEIAPREDGRLSVTCRISAAGGKMMESTVSVSTAREAEQIKRRFLERPEETYRGILAILTGKVDYYM